MEQGNVLKMKQSKPKSNISNREPNRARQSTENQEIPFFKEEKSSELPKPAPMLMSDEEIEAELEKEAEKSQKTIFPDETNEE